MQQSHITSMARSQSSALKEAAGRLQQFDDQPLKAKFVARSLDFVAELARRLDERELGAAMASSSDAGTLITALSQPGAIGLFDADVLIPARLRGLKARDAMLASEGGTLDSIQVSTLLGVSPEAVDALRAAGKLLAADLGRRGHRYPTWQFTDQGVPLPGMEQILAILADHPPLAQIRFFLSGSHRLGGKRPLDLLRTGEIDPVLRAARMFGEQGAA
jgi:hypothetical protein